MSGNTPATVLICFDSHSPYLAFRVSRLAAALEARGLAERIELGVVLLAQQDASYGWDDEGLRDQYGGVPVEVLSGRMRNAGLAGFLRLASWRAGWRFLRLLWRRRPRLVLIGGYDRVESMAAGLTAWLFRWRVGVMTDSKFNDTELLGRGAWTEAMKGLLARRFQFFLVPGQDSADYVRFLTGGKRMVLSGAYDMVDNQGIAAQADSSEHDAAIYRHLGLPEGQPFFLMAIRFIEKKNVDRVIEAYGAYRSACSAPLPLVICGKGPLEARYHERLAQLELGEQVLVRPWLDYAVIPRATRLARCVILASTHDQWGMIVNETLAAGSPVLVSSRCGAHELVQNGRNGFTFHPWDSEHLGWLLTQLGEDAGLAERLAGNARSSAGRLSIEGFIDACLSVFRHYGLVPTEGENGPQGTP